MAPPSPARLYTTLVGAALVILGLVGFFSDRSWLNFLYIASGALGLLVAGVTPRPYALGLGAVYAGLAIWDFSGGEGWLHLALGTLGLAAAAATKRSRPIRGSVSTDNVEKEPRNRLWAPRRTPR
jgi:hypothetical protein